MPKGGHYLCVYFGLLHHTHMLPILGSFTKHVEFIHYLDFLWITQYIVLLEKDVHCA